MKHIFLFLVLAMINFFSYAQGFNIPLEYEQILQEIPAQSDYFYRVQQDGFGIIGYETITFLGIDSIGSIIENFIPVFSKSRDKAVFLNKIGFSYYEKKNYIIASHFFSYAFYIDNTYQYAAYNYACSVSLLDRPFAGDVAEYLEKAIELDENYKRKMRTDPDLQYFHKDPWFIVLSGTDIKTRTGLMDFLTNTGMWYGPSPGVSPDAPKLNFNSNGTVDIEVFYEDNDSYHKRGWEYNAGTYTVHDGYFLLNYNDKSFKGIIEKARDGSLSYYMQIDGFFGEYFMVYKKSPNVA